MVIIICSNSQGSIIQNASKCGKYTLKHLKGRKLKFVCLFVAGGRAGDLVPDGAGPLLLLLQAPRQRSVLVGGKGQPREGQSD